MKVPAIKQLVAEHSVEQLQQAEEAILSEQQPAFEVPGDDEGEQLTHILAAIWIKHEMDKNGWDFVTGLRNYSARVRKSID